MHAICIHLGVRLDGEEMLSKAPFLFNCFEKLHERATSANIIMFDVVSKQNFKAIIERQNSSNQFLIEWDELLCQKHEL